MEASEMAFTTQQKREWRNKPEVRDRQAAYKREWDVANRHERAEYQRAYRARRASAGALKGAGLSDQHSNLAPVATTARLRKRNCLATPTTKSTQGPSFTLGGDRGPPIRMIRIYEDYFVDAATA
jgi:hypothetical protein